MGYTALVGICRFGPDPTWEGRLVHRCIRSIWILSTGATLLASASAGAQTPTRPIHPDAPWARALDDELARSELERLYGLRDEDLPPADPIWDGTLLYDENSYGRSILEQRGLPPPPLPALDYDAAPGILYVAMDGVTLTSTCGGGDSAHSAKNCTPLVEGEVTFPSYGSGSQQSSLFQTLRNYYDPFNLVLTTTRPPDWIPYTMAVVGGSSSLANCGDGPCGGGTCGIANVQCDGLRRNHVSLTFPQSCGGVAEVAAQETAHNWGLEHTDNVSDLLYPFNNGGFKTFQDQCMDINHATSQNPVTQCGYVHELYCPNGGGEQQNSYAELMGVFGPRQDDDTPPQIMEIQPADGTVIGTDESVTITARVAENTNFVAAKWTWQEGLPEELDSFTRCTNKVCDEPYNVGVGFDPNAVNWDFVSLNQPPAGTYTFKFEVADAYGGYDSRTITLTVEDVGNGSGGSSGGSGGTDSGGTGDSSGDETGLDTGFETDDGSAGQTESGGSGVGDTDTMPSEMNDGDEGCACTAGRDSSLPVGMSSLLLLVLLRRRP